MYRDTAPLGILDGAQAGARVKDGNGVPLISSGHGRSQVIFSMRSKRPRLQ